MPVTSFAQHERRLLLTVPGIGETVVQRLEAAGFSSLSALRAAGAQRVVERVLAQLGGGVWHNRRRAIARAIALAPARGVQPAGDLR